MAHRLVGMKEKCLAGKMVVLKVEMMAVNWVHYSVERTAGMRVVMLVVESAVW